MAAEPRVFLSAEWRHLVLVNYEVPAALLEPLVPRGTALDRHRGSVFVSIVGFRFLNTRVLGCRVPGHVDFDEVNLRFYVRRDTQGETRRGVTFVKEIVPRRAIAAVARAAYNEPYVALPMRSEISRDTSERDVSARYGWRSRAGDYHLALQVDGDPALPQPGSDEAFITDHYWGYTRQRNGGTIEYHVVHPAWRLWHATAVDIGGDMAALYGPAFGEILSSPPVSAHLAEGSGVTVSRPVRIA